jgi:hypothetical protein
VILVAMLFILSSVIVIIKSRKYWNRVNSEV